MQRPASYEKSKKENLKKINGNMNTDNQTPGEAKPSFTFNVMMDWIAVLLLPFVAWFYINILPEIWSHVGMMEKVIYTLGPVPAAFRAYPLLKRIAMKLVG